MHRKKFLVSLATVTAAPTVLFGRSLHEAYQEGKAFVIQRGEGRYHGHIHLKGVNVNVQDVKVSGKDTNGALAIFEQTGLSPNRGVPLHLHHDQDEIFYVLEGEYHFEVGGERHELKAGASIFLPRKLPHAWMQVSERAKLMVVLQPAGKLEEFFLVMAGLKSEPTKEEMPAIFANHGMQVVGPPMKG
jgi:quercetin dioxygenase-like cupin family protein